MLQRGVLVEDFLCYCPPVFFEFEFPLFAFFSALFVPILFENDHHSSWWSTCLMLVFCKQTKSHMATDKKGGARPLRSRLNPVLTVVQA